MEDVQKKVSSIVDTVSKTVNKDGNCDNPRRRNRILWVDDNPNNNVYERKAFEANGFEFELALHPIKRFPFFMRMSLVQSFLT